MNISARIHTLPFAKNASGPAPTTQRALKLLDIERQDSDVYARDLVNQYGLSRTDAENIVERGFFVARNLLLQNSQNTDVVAVLEKSIGKAHEEYALCVQHCEDEQHTRIDFEELQNAINDVSRALIKRGYTPEGATDRIKSFLAHLPEEDKIALIEGTADEAAMDRLNRIIAAMMHPGPKLIHENPEFVGPMPQSTSALAQA